MEAVLTKLGKIGIIPVIEIEHAEDAVPLALALIAGGMTVVEITFRTAAAEAAIRSIVDEFPDMLVGAGTVLNEAQSERAAAAGAHFIVSPGFSPSVVRWCQDWGLPMTPGVSTPTEIMQALDFDLKILKFFPAEALGGIPMLKALSAPFKGVLFIPTGGIAPSNLSGYLGLPGVHACGGSWLAPKKLISAGDFGEITRLASEAVEIVRKTRAKTGRQ